MGAPCLRTRVARSEAGDVTLSLPAVRSSPRMLRSAVCEGMGGERGVTGRADRCHAARCDGMLESGKCGGSSPVDNEARRRADDGFREMYSARDERAGAAWDCSLAGV